jgi:hypothetical protein
MWVCLPVFLLQRTIPWESSEHHSGSMTMRVSRGHDCECGAALPEEISELPF